MSSSADHSPSQGMADDNGAPPGRSSSPAASSSRLPTLPSEPTYTRDKKRRRSQGGTPEELAYEAGQSSSQRQRLNDGSHKNRSPATEPCADQQLDENVSADTIPSGGSSSSRQQSHLSSLPPPDRPLPPLHPNPPSTSSGISPPRVRRPPVSQSAWSALRERIGASSPMPHPNRTSSPLTGGGRALALPDHAGQTIRGGPDLFSRSSGLPLDNSDATRSPMESVAAGSPAPHLSQPASARWGPGAVIAALMSDILGFTARNGQNTPSLGLGSTPVSPAQVGLGTTTASTSASPSAPRPPIRPPYQRGWTTMPPPPPSTPPGITRSGPRTPVPDRVRLFPLGGTSIVVQGAMVARLNRPEAEAARENTRATAVDEDESDLAHDPSHTGPQPSDRGDSQETQGATTGDSIPTWGDAQASMLTRLLSIAAAATASSLASAPATSAVGVRADTPSTTTALAGHLRTHQPHVPAGSPPGLLHIPTSSHGGRSGGGGGGGGSQGASSLWPLQGSGESGASHNSGRLRRSIASLTSRFLGRLVSQQGREQGRLSGDGPLQTASPTGSSNRSDDEAIEVDSSLGVGSRSYAAAGAGASGASTNGTGDSDTRRALSMSEMLQEAIRDGAAPGTASQAAPDRPHEGSGSTDADVNSADEPSTPAATPAAPQISLAEYLARVLTAARENRLQRGPEGSFERWLYDLSDDLDHAVRAMTNSSISQGVTTASAAGPGGAPSDLAAARDSNESHSGQGAQSRRALDVEEGQLSFFRLFRLDGRGLHPSTTNHTSTTASNSGSPTPSSSALPPNTPSGLVPCVVVGVRSLSTTSQPVTPQNAIQRFRNLLAGTPSGFASGHVREQSTQTDQAASTTTRNEESSTATEPHNRSSMNQSTGTGTPQTHGAPATADGETGTSAEHDDSSRFLLFVSGGHYPPNHPLLSTPSNIAARDLMILIEVLSNLNAANAANAAAGAGGRVTKEDLEVNGPSIKKWGEIKADAVDVDAKEGTKTSDGGTGQLAPRAGDRCAVCLEEWSDEDAVRILGCRHAYHQACVDQWLLGSSNSCPMCRQVAVGKGARQNASSDRSTANAGSARAAGG